MSIAAILRQIADREHWPALPERPLLPADPRDLRQAELIPWRPEPQPRATVARWQTDKGQDGVAGGRGRVRRRCDAETV
jgi:hypothetical protein